MASSNSFVPKPDIPEEMLARWQGVVDLVAAVVEVPAALVTRIRSGNFEVVVASGSEGNPYQRGDRHSLDLNHYCKKVIAQRSMLHVLDARRDPEWEGNPALDLGMVSYLGIPIPWPDGEVFGGLCAQDSEANEFSARHKRFLTTLKDLLESDLKMLLQSAASLESAEAKFTTAFQESPIPMVISTIDEGRLKEVNRAFEETVGYRADEVIGRTAIDIGLWYDTADREVWVKDLRRAGRIRNIELRFRRKSGEVIYCRTTANIVEIDGERCLLTAVEDITEQLRVEKALKESEGKYRSFVENFAGIAYQGKDFVPIFFHGDVKGITGYEERDFLSGKPTWKDIVHPDDLGVFSTEDAKKLHDPGSHTYEREYRIVRKDDQIVWIHESIQGICDESGAYSYLQGTLVDITERKLAEEELRKHRELLRTILESSADGILAVDSQGKVLLANRRFAEMWRVPREIMNCGDRSRLVRFSMDQLCDPEGFLARVEQLYGVLDEDLDVLELKDGRIFERYSRPLVLNDSNAGRVWSFRDITERRRAEEALRASERKFRAVFDQSNQLTGLLALDGTVLEANQSSLQMAGIDGDSVIGKPFLESPWWSDSPEEQEELLSAFRNAVSGESTNVEITYPGSEGHRRVFKGILNPLTDDEDNVVGVIPVGFDITDIKRAEQAVRASREQLRALAIELSTAEERERRRIATNLHDQLGQALAVMRMKFGALTAASDEQESKSIITDIRTLLERAIEDISTLTFDLSPPILYELGIEAAIEWIGEKVCGESELAFEFSDDGLAKPLQEDAKPLLYRCARELLMNVVKHSSASSVKVEIEREGPTIRLAVQDDGNGFDPAIIREHGEDSGFGLYSIQERMQYLGGSFGIESEPGRGTRAWICAPIKGATP